MKSWIDEETGFWYCLYEEYGEPQVVPDNWKPLGYVHEDLG